MLYRRWTVSCEPNNHCELCSYFNPENINDYEYTWGSCTSCNRRIRKFFIPSEIALQMVPDDFITKPHRDVKLFLSKEPGPKFPRKAWHENYWIENFPPAVKLKEEDKQINEFLAALSKGLTDS